MYSTSPAPSETTNILIYHPGRNGLLGGNQLRKYPSHDQLAASHWKTVQYTRQSGLPWPQNTYYTRREDVKKSQFTLSYLTCIIQLLIGTPVKIDLRIWPAVTGGLKRHSPSPSQPHHPPHSHGKLFTDWTLFGTALPHLFACSWILERRLGNQYKFKVWRIY